MRLLGAVPQLLEKRGFVGEDTTCLFRMDQPVIHHNLEHAPGGWEQIDPGSERFFDFFCQTGSA